MYIGKILIVSAIPRRKRKFRHYITNNFCAYIAKAFGREYVYCVREEGRENYV